MDFNALIKKNVNSAFRIAGSLATTVLFTPKSTSSFNFGTQATNISASAQVTLKGFKTRETKQRPGESQNSRLVNVVFKTEDIGDPSHYSTAVFDNSTWRLVAPFDINEFVTTVSFAKEE